MILLSLKKNIIDISKKLAAKNLDSIFFENLFFSKCRKMVKF
jgi:hypothetical protein